MIKKLRLFSTLLLLAVASAAWGDEVTDVITSTNLAATGTSYTDFKDVKLTSSAVYAGNSAKSSDGFIQMRSKNSNSGIVSTTSGGKVKSVTITVGSGANTIDVYGSKTAYTAASDLYDSSKQGTKIGSVTATGTITFTDDYEYVGIRSNNGAIYVSKIEIVWENGGSATETCATPTFNPAAGTYTSAQSVTISSETEDATIYYTTDGSVPTTSNDVYSGAISVTANTTFKAIAVKKGLGNSAVATATYTIVTLEHAGTAEDPYTVADAITLLSADPAASYENVYVKGIISQIDSYNSKYSSITYWISDDGETTTQFEVYSGKGLNGADFSDKTDLTVGNTVVVKGTIKKYNTTYEFDINSEIVSMESVSFPVINAEESLELPYDATNGSFNYFITNPEEGKSLTATTTADWISNIQVGEESVTFTTTQNEGTANRTATIALTYEGAESVTVTVTQRYYVVDYATLPFEFNGGRGDIATTAGLTQSGLGDDYKNAPKLKFDHAGDELVLKFNERPGKLTFDVKGNPGGDPSVWNAVFKVQTSTDGINYTDLASYDNLESTNTTKEFNTLDANVRYIKWVYTEKVSGNVALGNIKLEAYVAPQNFTLTIPETDNVTITAAYGEDQMLEEGQNAEIEQNTEIILTVDAAEGYDLKSLTVTGLDGQSFAPQAVPNTEGAYKFTMPAYNATVNAAVVEHVEPSGDEVWEKTNLADLTPSDVFVIVGNNGDYYAMSNDNGTSSAPAAVAVTISDDKITSAVAENIKWNISGNAEDGYTFYPNGSTEKWLYCTNTNNGVRVGTNENNTFTLDNGYLKHNGTSRYVGIYNSQDWRCYTSSGGNIANQTFSFYKKVENTPQTVNVTIGASATGADGAYYSSVYYSDKALKVPAGVECQTYKMTDGKLSVSKTYAAGSVVPAGQAVVIKASDSGEVTFTVTSQAGEADAESQLLGVDKATTITETGYKYYKLTLNSSSQTGTAGFYFDKNSNGGTRINAAAHKCYLRIPAAQAAKSAFVFGEETTGINAVSNEQMATDKVYNLSGQRVQKATKGIYIVNGKKVVMK